MIITATRPVIARRAVLAAVFRPTVADVPSRRPVSNPDFCIRAGTARDQRLGASVHDLIEEGGYIRGGDLHCSGAADRAEGQQRAYRRGGERRARPHPQPACGPADRRVRRGVQAGMAGEGISHPLKVTGTASASALPDTAAQTYAASVRTKPTTCCGASSALGNPHRTLKDPPFRIASCDRGADDLPALNAFVHGLRKTCRLSWSG